jgi:carbon-monoxide dehydrogenase medium subunit
MRQIARGDRKPDSVLYVGALRQLALVERKSTQGPRIGALATQSDLAESEIFSTDYQALRQAAASCGSCQSRNVGTLGGNLCNGSPQADLVPALLVHDAVVTLESRERGARTQPLGEFISGPASTGRLPDELLIGVDLDGSPPRTADTYIKVGRRGAMEAAIVGLAVRVTVSASGQRLDDIRIAVGGIAPKAFRATGAESILRGQSPTDEVIRDAAAAVLRQAAPADDVLATASYRIGLVPGILARAVKSCVERAGHLPE